MTGPTVFYRFEEQFYAPSLDEFGNIIPGTGSLTIRVMELPVLKTTPQGAWIETARGKRRFVLLSARKTYANPDKAKALKSFLARKERQAKIYRSRLRAAERLVLAVQKEEEKILALTTRFSEYRVKP